MAPTDGKPEAAAEPLDDGHNQAELGAAGKTQVSIENFTFSPGAIEVPAGTKVTWVNADDVPHTVRSSDNLFRSEALDTDDKFEHLFSEPGSYEYYCGLHTHMTGKVVVK